jgi:hypothetical protein
MIRPARSTVLIIAVPAGRDYFLHEYHTASAQPADVKAQIAAKYGITFLSD